MGIFGAFHGGYGDSAVNLLTHPDEATTFAKAWSAIHSIHSTQAEVFIALVCGPNPICRNNIPHQDIDANPVPANLRHPWVWSGLPHRNGTEHSMAFYGCIREFLCQAQGALLNYLAQGQIFHAKPVSDAWTKPTSTVIHYIAFLLVIAALNTALDLSIVALPLFAIRKLHMSPKRKLLVSGMFLLGIL